MLEEVAMLQGICERSETVHFHRPSPDEFTLILRIILNFRDVPKGSVWSLLDREMSIALMEFAPVVSPIVLMRSWHSHQRRQFAVFISSVHGLHTTLRISDPILWPDLKGFSLPVQNCPEGRPKAWKVALCQTSASLGNFASTLVKSVTFPLYSFCI